MAYTLTIAANSHTFVRRYGPEVREVPENVVLAQDNVVRENKRHCKQKIIENEPFFVSLEKIIKVECVRRSEDFLHLCIQLKSVVIRLAVCVSLIFHQFSR